jgi:uncharacterized membrane protein
VSDPNHVPPPIPPHAPAPTPVPFPVGSSPMTEKEISEGKAFALLCYAINLLGWPFWIVPLVMRDNDYALYHAKQAMMAWIGVVAIGAVGGVLCVILSFVCIGYLLLPVLILAVIVLDLLWNIMGLINAANGRCQPLFMIGTQAENWFRGMTKVAK